MRPKVYRGYVLLWPHSFVTTSPHSTTRINGSRDKTPMTKCHCPKPQYKKCSPQPQPNCISHVSLFSCCNTPRKYQLTLRCATWHDVTSHISINSCISEILGVKGFQMVYRLSRPVAILEEALTLCKEKYIWLWRSSSCRLLTLFIYQPLSLGMT